MFAKSDIATGINYLSTEPLERYPGLHKVELSGKLYSGRVYVSESGGVNPGILCDIVKNLWGPCYPDRSEESPIGTICDMYGDHRDLELLNVMIEQSFRGCMGLPNGTQTWQLADRFNNGQWQIAVVHAKRVLLDLKRQDLMKPEAERRIPPGEHERLMPTDQVIIVNMAYKKSYDDIAGTKRAIEVIGIKPFTKVGPENNNDQ
jgi:hypothetical protein